MKKSTAQIIAGAGAASLIAMSAAFAGGAADTTTSQSSSGITESGQASETVSQTSASAASANATQSTANSSATETAELPQATAARQKQEKKGFDAVENDELVIDTASIGDGDGMGSIQIQWQISDDGDVWLSLPGAIRPSFVPRDSEVGRYLRVQISYVDGQGNPEMLISPMSEAVMNVNDKPTGMPIINGDAKEDSQLSADLSRISDEDGLGEMSIIWQRSTERQNWENFPDQFGAILQLKQGDVGFNYRSVVSYIDGFGTRETLVSEPSGIVVNVDNPLEGEVTIRGQAIEGAELIANTSSLTDYDGISSLALFWEASSDGRTWEPLSSSGEARRLNLPQALVGNLIRARANVVDNFGVETVVYSTATEAVRNINNKPDGNIFIRRVTN
ncbi:MAG: hypothetical protein HON95_07910 [Alphaproteobacteria bacterium]|nr:hypothetical protein [Alphaproteobacteria bacterium]